ncbi:MAG: 50S ribosomal protein L22 [Nanoarchaeota archaeon]
METKNYAVVRGRSLNVSTKFSIEICNKIRGMKLGSARRFLEDVIKQNVALPVRRHNFDLGHKPGKIGPGRYPVKSSQMFIRLLNSLEANASNKGMSVNNLYVEFAKSDKGEVKWRAGRKGRQKMKNTHIELRAGERNK